MATFTWTPSFTARASYKPRVRTARFGDGYEQRLADGINVRPAVWALTFDNRDNTETAALLAFLQARNGVEAFDWTPPYEASAIRVVCREWNKSIAVYNSTTISAQFEQVFEP